MAKVIKRGGNIPAPTPQPAKKVPQKRSGKVIDREVYNAQQRAQQIILKGENEKQHREEQGHLNAQKTYEDIGMKHSHYYMYEEDWSVD